MASTPMSAQDALWLTMDRPNNLMVIDGAMVLTEPVDIDDVPPAISSPCSAAALRKRVRRGSGSTTTTLILRHM